MVSGADFPIRMLPLLSHKLHHNVFCPCHKLAYHLLTYSIINVVHNNMNKPPTFHMEVHKLGSLKAIRVSFIF